MLRNPILRLAVCAAAGSASVAQAQQAIVAVQNSQPVAAVTTFTTPASPVVTPQTVALPAVNVPATVVYPLPGGSSLATSITPQPTVSVVSTIPQQAGAQQTQIYTPSYYYYYYTPPQPTAYSYPMNWSPPTIASMAPVMPAAPIGFSPWNNGFGVYGVNGAFGLPGSNLGGGFGGMMFNARGEAGHVRYPYYSYRRPWYYPGQPNFNVTIPGHVW
ncbi:hypothetical protein GC176_13300 [bacterium]|nr:hypothetical protein [bacterium]